MPFDRYSLTQSHPGISRWKYRIGGHDAAVEFADTAARADATWNELDFGLPGCGRRRRLGAPDTGDPLCRQHPHIIQNLKELSAEEIVAVRDEPDTDKDGNAAD